MAEAGTLGTAEPLLARSPIAQPPPVETSGGWEVSARRSDAPLRLADASPLTKVLVSQRSHDQSVEPPFDVPFGGATRDADGPLVVGTRPGEWTVIGAPEAVWERVEAVRDAARGTRRDAARDAVRDAAPSTAPTVVDLTHGLALMRLTGDRAPTVLATLCGIDLGDAATPDGAAFTSSVAKVTADVVREDMAGERSYLLAADRAYGQYLFDMIRDAGARSGLDVDGFPGWR